jgi:DNA end-binding protein Ku
VKGYETGQGEYVILESDEIAAAVPESDKTLAIESFIACRDIDDVYFDRPYYLAPSDPVAVQAFNLIRDGMRNQKVAALARAVLFRRVRTVLIRAHGTGLIATTLNFDYEVRAADEAFDELPKRKIESEMLDLAKHIIATKQGKFDPTKFDDRYESALGIWSRRSSKASPCRSGRPSSQPRAATCWTPCAGVPVLLAESRSAGPPPKPAARRRRPRNGPPFRPPGARRAR